MSCRANNFSRYTLKVLIILTYLQVLQICIFDGLDALPECFGNLCSLKCWKFGFSKNLNYLHSVESIRRLTNLRYLRIDGCPLLEERCNKERLRAAQNGSTFQFPSIKLKYIYIVLKKKKR